MSQFLTPPPNKTQQNKIAPVPFEAYTPLSTTDTMLDAMLVMGKFRLQRVPVMDSTTGRLVNFITQRTVLQHIHALCLTGVVDTSQSISALGLPFTHRVVAVNQHEPIINAFHLMTTKVSWC